VPPAVRTVSIKKNSVHENLPADWQQSAGLRVCCARISGPFAAAKRRPTFDQGRWDRRGEIKRMCLESG
jgi:hypothetical protein